MIQRFLYRIIQAGIAQLQADPDYVEQLFLDEYEMPANECAVIKKLFVDKTPKVVFGYALPDAQFPLVSIVLGAESAPTNFLGSDAGMVEDDEDAAFGQDVYSNLWTHSYSLFIMSEHPDATAYYYEIIKAILVMSAPALTSKGLYDVSISGEELMPDERFKPEFVFGRRLVFRAQREFSRPDPKSALGKAFKVDGIYVDRSGSRSDPGPVQTLVTVPESSEGSDG